MNELALFAGAGGGILGSKLLGHRIIGYVENDEYCQKIIAQRIEGGILDKAPIFSNIQAFNRAGFAEQYKGMVDLVSGGFPCQDISCAGKGEGITGSRSALWFEMEQTIRVVEPRLVYIENSPMLFVRGFEHILSALSEMGFHVAWGIVSAADLRAPHLRRRLWVLAYSELPERWTEDNRGCRMERPNDRIQKRQKNPSRFECSGKDVADPLCGRRRKGRPRRPLRQAQQQRPSEEISNTSSQGLPTPKQEDIQGAGRWQEGRTTAQCGWWSIEPALGRVAHGVAYRVDRLRAIGNGQVPIVAATAFRILQAKLGAYQ